ncbi:MAG: hypothetical protein KJ067_11895 [Vicinamibacteria bacterium]|nr:hypothetical protein [Vicinamibacteria bacterium]
MAPSTQPILGPMRCDLHVHSRHSGPLDAPLLRHLGTESCSDPEAVYAAAKGRGMDLVTLTDHDTIEGALRLAGRPDTFLSEELTAWVGGREVHLGVLDLEERHHAPLQARARDGEALFAYLAEQRLPVVLNHPFSSLTGPREPSDITWSMRHVTHVETRNGMMPSRLNALANRLSSAHGRPGVGGSDAHAPESVARAWTEVPGVRDRTEFLAGLRAGACLARGTSGSYARLTRDVATIVACGIAQTSIAALAGDRAWRLAALAALCPLLPMLPLVVAAERLRECAFGAWLARRLWGGAGPLRPGLGRWVSEA